MKTDDPRRVRALHGLEVLLGDWRTPSTSSTHEAWCACRSHLYAHQPPGRLRCGENHVAVCRRADVLCARCPGRAGSATSARRAPASARMAPRRSPTVIPDMNADRAASPSCAPIGPGRCAEAPRAPPRDPRAAWARAGAAWCAANAVVTPCWYRVAIRLPMTATPNAPPICRKAPLVAEPTPVCSAGTDPMTDPVAAGITKPAPTPIRTRPRTIPPYVVPTVAPEISRSPPETHSMPATTVSLVPSRRTRAVDTGATTAIAPAAGRLRTPACNAV